MTITDESVEPRDCPYMGLDYFQEKFGAWFFGRDADGDKIITNLQAARLTLLHAESGVGKSSLLRAGVAWRLRQTARKQSLLGSAFDIPVVFSSWKDDPALGLIDAIGVAINPFLAGSPRPELPRERLDAAIDVAADAVNVSLFIILDQFEEYFLYRSREQTPGRFANELARCINRADLPANFLIAIREDAYAGLGDLFKGRTANVYGNYLHIEYLDRASAEKAIRAPLSVYNELPGVADRVEIQDELVEAVLDQVRAYDTIQDGAATVNGGGRVATPLLQLVMETVWERERAEGSHELRLSTLEKLEGVGKIIDTHLTNSLRTFSEKERQTAIDMFDHLVTPSGGKIAESVPDLAGRTGHSEAQVSEVLDKLDHERIVRPVPAPPGRDPVRFRRYEIFHDVLTPAISRAIAARQERRRVRQLRRLVVLVASLLAIALASVGVFYALWQDAVSQSHLAQSEEMAVEAMNLLPADAPLAMLLSLQAYERAPSLEAESALIQAAQQPLEGLLVSGSSQVDGVAFSPDGRTLAAGDDGGHVGLWDVAAARRTATLAEGIPVSSVAFSPDGRTLAVSDYGGYVGLWDVAAARRTATLAVGSSVESVAFSPDGHTLAVSDHDGVGLWDVAAGRRTATLAEGSPVDSVAFSPDGRTLAAADDGGHVGLWDVAAARRTATLAEGSPVDSVAFSPDGHTLAAGDYGGHVGLWDVAAARRTATLAEGSLIESVAFSPDGHTLAVSDHGGHVGLWDVAAARRTANLAEGSPVYNLAFSPDGRTLAAGDRSGHVGLWDVAAGQRVSNVAEGSPVYSLAFSLDGRTLAVGDLGGYVGLWDVAAGRRTATLAEGSPVYGVAFSPDGRTLAVGDIGGHVSLWDVAAARRTATLAEGGPVYGVAFSRDGRTLAVGDLGGHVGLWDVAAGRRTATLAEGSAVFTVGFSRDERTLAVGDLAGHVGLWDVAAGRRTATLAEGSPVYSLAFSPDGRTLAVGDYSGHVGLWDVAAGHRLVALAEASPVYSVAFSPNGTTLVTGDYLGNVGIWSVANWQRLANLVEGSAVTSMAFSPHSLVLAIASLDGNIALLRQDLANLTQPFFMHLICGKVRGNMTRAQWAEYAPGQPYQKTCS